MGDGIVMYLDVMLIDFAYKAHFSPAFLPEIPPGNFLFLPEISNFTLGQFLNETRNVAILIYKHCIFISIERWIDAGCSNIRIVLYRQRNEYLFRCIRRELR